MVCVGYMWIHDGFMLQILQFSLYAPYVQYDFAIYNIHELVAVSVKVR